MTLTHGKAHGYNQGCHCDLCRAANTARARTRRERLRAERVLIDGRWTSLRATHGTLNGYGNWQCRCVKCTKVHTENLNKLRKLRREKARRGAFGD